MAKRFSEAGIPVRAVSADTGREERDESLRLVEGKDCLTVLDFIGQQHTRIRFDLLARPHRRLARHPETPA